MRDLPPAANGTNMKKKPVEPTPVRRRARVAEDEILPEYSLRGSKRSPYTARLRGAVIAVTLDPDVAAAFPDSRSVNRALRALIAVAPKGRRTHAPHQSERRDRSRSAK